MFTTSVEKNILFFLCSNNILLPFCIYQYNHWNLMILFWHFTWQTRSLITPFYHIVSLFIRILVLTREVYCYPVLNFEIPSLPFYLFKMHYWADADTREPSSTVWWICIRQSVISVMHVACTQVNILRTISLLVCWCYCLEFE